MGQARQSASTKRLGALAAAHAAFKKDRQDYLTFQAELATKARKLDAEVIRRVAEATAGYRGRLDDARMSTSAWIEATYAAQQSAARVGDQCTKLRAENKALRTLSAVLLAGIAIIGTGALFLL